MDARGASKEFIEDREAAKERRDLARLRMWIKRAEVKRAAMLLSWKDYSLERHPELGALPWVVLRPGGELIAYAASLDAAKGVVEYDLK